MHVKLVHVMSSEPVPTTLNPPTGWGPHWGKRAPHWVKGPHIVVKGLICSVKEGLHRERPKRWTTCWRAV